MFLLFLFFFKFSRNLYDQFVEVRMRNYFIFKSTCYFQVAGTSGKAVLEGGSDDEGASTEAHGRAIIEVLGREKRNEVLAAVYMVRTDVSLSVRQV